MSGDEGVKRVVKRKRATSATGKKGSTRPSGFRSAKYGYRRTVSGGRGGTVSSLFFGPRPPKAEDPDPQEARASRAPSSLACPFLRMVPISGKVGTAVKILGTNLTGAISVNFAGSSADFKVVSDSLITTVVPVGANTGKVRVVTPPPGGTLESDVFFEVVRRILGDPK